MPKLIERWQRMFEFGESPFIYVINGREYTHDAAVKLVRDFEVGANAA